MEVASSVDLAALAKDIARNNIIERFEDCELTVTEAKNLLDKLKGPIVEH